MKKYFLFISVALFFNSMSVSQNLIPNSDFEQTETGEYIPNESIKQLKFWKKILPVYSPNIKVPILREMYIDTSYKFNFYYDKKSFKQYFADYTNFEKSSIDTTKLDYGIFIYNVLPYSGNCYIKSIGYKKRNLLQVKLKEPLKKNHYYYFEMYYRLGTRFSKLTNQFKSMDFGVLFSNNDFSKKVFKNELFQKTIKYKPQIIVDKFPSECIDKWVKFSIIIKVNTDYNYILIGNHSKPNNNVYCEFYIDKLQLIPFDNYFSSKYLKKEELIKIPNIFFKLNSSILEKESYTSLNLLTSFLKNTEKIKIQINGHTDNTGSDKINKELSKNRAKAVAEFLISKGINKTRLTYKGYGSTKPIDTNNTAKGRQNNRRVEVKIIKH